MKDKFSKIGYKTLSPKDSALRVQDLLKQKRIRPESAKKFYLAGRNVYDTTSETYNFNPDWTYKDLETLITQGFYPGDEAINPSLLEGFKSPNSHDRSNQKPKKVIYLDKKTRKLVNNLNRKFSYEVEVEGKIITHKPDFSLSVEERVNYLSELQCCLHHLNYQVYLGTGRLKNSSECLALLVEILYTEQYWKSIDWYWFYDTLARRAYSNSFQGDWATIARLLQCSSSKSACLGVIRNLKETKFCNKKGNFSKAKWNDFRLRGQRARNKVSYSIRLSDPVKHKQFKRGFQHGNPSGNLSSKTTEEESDLLISHSSWTRDLTLPPTEKESIMNFLYNNKRPIKEKTLSTEGKYYSKTEEYFVPREDNNLLPKRKIRLRNNFLKEEFQRIKNREKSFKEKVKEKNPNPNTSSEVIVYRLTPEQLKLKIQEIDKKLEEKIPSYLTANQLELEEYK